MASKSMVDLIGGRIGGLKDEKFHLTYRPPYVRADGKEVQARIKFSVFTNEGRQQNVKPDTIIMWTNMAWPVWLLTKGKEITLTNMEKRSWMGRVFDNAGNVAKNPDGTDIMVKRYDFTVRDVIRDMHLGDDSAKFAEALMAHLKAEEAAGRMPQGWDVMGSPGNREWRILQRIRNTTPYAGGDSFGYAKVEPIPEGATLKLLPMPSDAELRAAATAHVDGQGGGSGTPNIVTGTGAATGAPAAPPVTGPDTVSNAFNNTVQVEGFTREQYLASGWTDDQLRADAKFAAFFSAPAAPAAPTVPAPPANAAAAIVGA
jgi:hypothetical protein